MKRTVLFMIAVMTLLASCNSADNAAPAEASELAECVRQFLNRQNTMQQKIFMQRYFYMLTGPEIAAGLGITESRVTVTLTRQRKKLREHLKKEGFL